MNRTDRTVPGDRRCPSCLKPVRPVHFYADGTTRCAHGNRFWTPARLFQLAELTECGWSDDRIAATLAAQWDRPMTGHAVHIARWRHGQPGHRAIGLPAERVATMLGLTSHDAVQRWIANGWLPARREAGAGRGRSWRIERDALWTFVADPLHWHRWTPVAVTDPVLQAHVRAVRTEPTHVPIRDALVRLEQRGLYVSRSTLDRWVRGGLLPSIRPAANERPVSRKSLLMIPVAALDVFVLPPIGGAAHPKRRAA